MKIKIPYIYINNVLLILKDGLFSYINNNNVRLL